MVNKAIQNTSKLSSTWKLVHVVRTIYSYMDIVHRKKKWEMDSKRVYTLNMESLHDTHTQTHIKTRKTFYM